MTVESVDPVSLASILDLERLDQDLYRSTATFWDHGSVYGGQALAQALRAAARTVLDGFVAHSLHGTFIRAGDPQRPILFEVTRDRDGRSYCARRVVARQGGLILLNALASFHAHEPGPDSQAASLPAVPMPEDVASFGVATRARGIEFRDANPESTLPVPSTVWARAIDEPGLYDDPNLIACLIAYVSDMCTGVYTLVDFDWNVRLTSLDHSLWFLRPMTSEWMLLDLQGESVHQGRGLYRGRVFDTTGRQLAALTQESLYRALDRPRPETIRRVRR